jgi:hypothetical protein
VQNAYAVSKQLGEEERSWWEFKFTLCKFLMHSQGQNTPSKRKTMHENKVSFEELKDKPTNVKNMRNMVEGIESNMSDHFLLHTLDHKATPCFGCKLMDDTSTARTILTCFGCKKGFHPYCFAAFHCRKMSDVDPRIIMKFHEVLTNPDNDDVKRLSANRCTPDDLEQLEAPTWRINNERKENAEQEDDGKPRATKRAKRGKRDDESD